MHLSGCLAQARMEELVSKKTASDDAHSRGELRKPRRSLRRLPSRLTLRTALFVTAISSVGAWLAIWEAVRALASVLPG